MRARRLADLIVTLQEMQAPAALDDIEVSVDVPDTTMHYVRMAERRIETDVQAHDNFMAALRAQWAAH